MARLCKRCGRYVPTTHSTCAACGCKDVVGESLSARVAHRIIAGAMVGSVATLTLGCYGESTKYGGPFGDEGGAAGAAGNEGLGGDANLGGAPTD